MFEKMREAFDPQVMFDISSWDVAPADIGVFIGYFVLMLIVGYVCRKSSSDVSDYVRMGCKSTWWLMGMSLFMQQISALTFTGACGMGYVAGWSALSGTFGLVGGLICQAIFFAPWLRRTRAVTPSDAVRLRYGPVAEQAFTYIAAFTGTFWGGAMLLGLATFMSAIFGLPVATVILFVGIIVVFYSVSGGSWSVQITDSLQSMIMVPICLVVLFMSLHAVGGLGGLFSAIEANGLTDHYKFVMEPGHDYQTTAMKVPAGFFTIPWFIASFIGAFIQSANMTVCWKFLATKSDSHARMSALLAAGLLLFGAFIWYIPPMVARIKFSDQVDALAKVETPETETAAAAAGTGAASTADPDVKPAPTREKLGKAADGAYAIAAKNLLPPGLLGLIVLAMFAATMSSMDSALTGTAGLITNNLYPPLARLIGTQPLEGKSLLRLTQVVNLLLGMWAVTFALLLNFGAKNSGIYAICLNIALLVGAPTGLAFALSFFVKKLPSWGPLVGMTCGFTLSALYTWAKEPMNDICLWLTGQELMYHNRVFGMLIVVIGSTMLTSLLWPTAKAAYRKKVDHFFLQIRTPVDFEKEVGQSADHSLLTMVGSLGLLMAAAIGILIFFAENTAGRWSVVFVVLFIGGISAWMYIAGLAARRKNAAAATVELPVAETDLRDAADD